MQIKQNVEIVVLSFLDIYAIPMSEKQIINEILRLVGFDFKQKPHIQTHKLTIETIDIEQLTRHLILPFWGVS